MSEDTKAAEKEKEEKKAALLKEASDLKKQEVNLSKKKKLAKIKERNDKKKEELEAKKNSISKQDGASPSDTSVEAAPAAFMGGSEINSLLRLDLELEKIRLDRKRINNLLENKKLNKIGGNNSISDNSNFIPHNKVVLVDTYSDTSVSENKSKLEVSDYKKNLNETLYKLKNEVPLNANLNRLLSKYTNF
jgi:hypothetical protein